VQVEEARKGPQKPSADVIEASKLPKRIAIAYRVMYAHRMHFCV